MIDRPPDASIQRRGARGNLRAFRHHLAERERRGVDNNCCNDYCYIMFGRGQLL
jgi:hypothetical protein